MMVTGNLLVAFF